MAADIIPMAYELDTVDVDREGGEEMEGSVPVADGPPITAAMLRGAGSALALEE